ncbi:MAG: ABC transporter permease [Chloroflexi bacterium]|nr:ABC transporter permease [Chloroflexota bacterium]
MQIGRRKPLGTVALFFVVVLVIVALGAPLLAPYDPLYVHRMVGGSALKGPGVATAALPPTIERSPIFVNEKGQGPPFLLGSDDKGRDILSRIIYGARVSLMVAVIAVGMGTFSGALVGLISGFFEGKTDLILQRIVDGLMAFPGIILAMSIVAVLGASTVNTFLALSVIIAPNASRVVRGAVLTIKQNMYVDAARAIGATPLRIMFQHVLPNVTAPIIILASVTMGNAILLESSLSFLGLGTPLPDPSWGNMLGGVSARVRIEDAPQIALAPGIAISLAVYAFNLFGDAMRDIWDPRLRGR